VPAHAAISLAGGRNVLPPLFLSTMGRLSGLRVRTEGRALKGALFLANHVSWLDILALASTIFPEGTTNDGTALLPFKSSLLSAVEPLAHAVPVQPVALDYADAPEIAWHGDEPGLANVRRILARPGRIDLTIRFLDPLVGSALDNRKTMTAAAQEAIARALSLPI